MPPKGRQQRSARVSRTIRAAPSHTIARGARASQGHKKALFATVLATFSENAAPRRITIVRHRYGVRTQRSLTHTGSSLRFGRDFQP